MFVSFPVDLAESLAELQSEDQLFDMRLAPEGSH